MNDDAFARLVAEEVKNRVSKSQREYLKFPENWSRWQRALIALDENLDGQLQRLDEDAENDRYRYESLGSDGVKLLAEAMSDYESRRSKVDRFRFHVGKRLDEVTRLIAMGADAADDEISAYSFLKRAIEKHRQMLEEFDLESTPIDHALWEAVDGKWSFDQISSDDLFSTEES
jgi:hypothetical protein